MSYSIAQGFPQLKILNDMGVRVYFDSKKKNAYITSYPLVIAYNRSEMGKITDSPEISQKNTELLVYEKTACFEIDLPANDVDEDMTSTEIITDISKQPIQVYQIYKNKFILAQAVRRHSVNEGFQYRTPRSCKSRYTVICVEDTCRWSLKARSIQKSKLFRVTSFNDVHTCPEHEKSRAKRNALTLFVSEILQDKLNDPKIIYTPTDIQRNFKKAHGLDLTYMQAWRAKEKAYELLRGKPKDSYAQLPNYLYMLEYSNPGTVTRLETEEDGSFLYLFIALNATIKGWTYCKPTLVVDSTFLEAMYRGIMLTSATQDAQGQIIPIAYSIVDSENDASWGWFFECLRDIYPQRDGMCIVSDRHDSIAKAAATLYPTIPHCVCMFHLWNNVKGNFKKKAKDIKNIYYALSRAYTVEEFNSLMKELDAIDLRVKPYLKDVGYHKWARSHCVANRTTSMTSNIVESVNAITKYARQLPIIDLLDFMTNMVQKWNYTNGNDAKFENSILTNKYEVLLNEANTEAQTMTVTPSTHFVHSVRDGQVKHTVSLHEQICTCGKFQINEFTCGHAMAVVRKFHLDKYTCCSPYYTRNYLQKAYEPPVHPLPDKTMCQLLDHISPHKVLPPNAKIPAERPRKQRGK